MPVRIGHQPAEDYLGHLGTERWTQKLPTRTGMYLYTECQVKGRAGAVWLCKIYRYKGKMWVRFYTGPYRMRLKGSRKPGSTRQVMYERTRLEGIRYVNGNIKLWLALDKFPKPPVEMEIGPAQVGGLPQKPGKIMKPRPKTVVVKRKYVPGRS